MVGIFHGYVSHNQMVTRTRYIPPLKQVTFFTSPSDHCDADLHRGTAHARCGGLCIRCWIPEDWLSTWNTSPWELMNFPGIYLGHWDFNPQMWWIWLISAGQSSALTVAIFRLLKAEAATFRAMRARTCSMDAPWIAGDDASPSLKTAPTTFPARDGLRAIRSSSQDW